MLNDDLSDAQEAASKESSQSQAETQKIKNKKVLYGF
jgi:hypothetical protein